MSSAQMGTSPTPGPMEGRVGAVPLQVGGPRAFVVALVAAGVGAVLWLLSGVLSGILYRLDLPLGSLGTLVPYGMRIMPGGRLTIEVVPVLSALLLGGVILFVTFLAARGQVPGHGRMALFFAGWFAAVAGSVVATTLQSVSYLQVLDGSMFFDRIVRVFLGSGHWGVVVGWLVGLAAVLAAVLAVRRPVPVG